MTCVREGRHLVSFYLRDENIIFSHVYILFRYREPEGGGFFLHALSTSQSSERGIVSGGSRAAFRNPAVNVITRVSKRSDGGNANIGWFTAFNKRTKQLTDRTSHLKTRPRQILEPPRSSADWNHRPPELGGSAPHTSFLRLSSKAVNSRLKHPSYTPAKLYSPINLKK